MSTPATDQEHMSKDRQEFDMLLRRVDEIDASARETWDRTTLLQVVNG